MKVLQFPCIIAALVVTYPFSQHEPSLWTTEKAVIDIPGQQQAKLGGDHFSFKDHSPLSVPPSEDHSADVTYPFLQRKPSLPATEKAVIDILGKKQAKLEEDYFSLKDYSPPPVPPSEDHSADAVRPKPDFSYLAYYAYSEVPPDTKPADTILESLKDVSIGAPIEEIKRASDAFGLDFTFMKAVAKIESGFDPKQRTGSYIGLFQLSNYEFQKYGSGKITDPRHNAIAAAYKFATEAILFELDTHKKPTMYDLYLIHQQGTQGAAEHVSHPERIAWQSMCATDEGRQKGEKWCRRAIWKNTLPGIKQVWKSVDRLTSGAFVEMWQQRMDVFYARYSQPDAPLPVVATTAVNPSPAPALATTLASSSAPAKKARARRVRLAVPVTQPVAPSATPWSAILASFGTAAKQTSGEPTARAALHHPNPGPKPVSTTASITANARPKKPVRSAASLAQKPAARRLAATTARPDGGSSNICCRH